MTYSIESEARWTANQIDAYLNGREAEERAAESFAAEYGEDWEVREGYGDRFIGEEQMTSEADYPGLDAQRDWEEHSLTL